MGEIGLNRLEYLYDLTFCDLLLIERGYEMRHRHLWFAERWGTFYTMMAFCGSENMKKSGLNNPTDLLHLPWDNQHAADGDAGEELTENDVKRLRALMQEENARLQSQKQ